jgi:hypothetical protein
LNPGFAEFYMAHLLGLQGARRFIALLSNTPEKSASKAFPRAAKANRALFFTPHQDTARKRKALAKALTITEVHGRLEGVITQRVVRYSSIRWGLPPAAVITP